MVRGQQAEWFIIIAATLIGARKLRAAGHGSPVGSLDLAAVHTEGTPYLIWPCVDCAAWHAEVLGEKDGYVFVREWHSTECPQFQSATPNPRRER